MSDYESKMDHKQHFNIVPTNADFIKENVFLDSNIN